MGLTGSESTAERALEVEWLGRVSYAEALALQVQAIEDRREGRRGDRLLLLEHPAVITLGRSSKPENLLESREQLALRGVEVHEVARGGDVTYHAPGQLVGYLVADLRARGQADVHAYLRRLEAALIDTLRLLGVPGRRIEGMTGVFVEPGAEASDAIPRKIASIGVGLRRWVTYHGFALNVDPDLGGFDAIVPCGLAGVEMTSVARELGVDDPAWMSRARAAAAEAFATRFA